MTGQLDMLDSFVKRGLRAQAAVGEALKQGGLKRVETNGKLWLEAMRAEAKRLCALSGCVTTDELRLYAEERRLYPHHDNCWGAVFNGKSWAPIGHRKSRWPSCHAREIRIWRYVGTAQ